MLRYLPLVMLVTIILGGCGPETLPAADAPSFQQPATAAPVAPSTLLLPVPDPSVPLTTSHRLTEPSPEATTTSPTSDAAAPIVPSLAITDPVKVDIFQIAEEYATIGEGAFPIHVTVGQGNDSVQLMASEPELVTLPCFPRQPAPQGRDYLCQLGRGFESELWLATWGAGLKRLVTGQAMGGTAWSDDGNQIAFGTLAGQDEAGNIPLKVLDLETGREIVIGIMSSPYQMAFTPNNEVMFVADSALQVVAIPKELSQDVGPVKAITLTNIPDNQVYSQSGAAWFKVAPGGTKVAIMRTWDGASGQLGILDVASGQETVIEELIRNNAYSIPNVYAWSPDGDTLAYLTMIEEGSVEEETITDVSELWLTDASGENRRRIWRSDRPFLGYTDLDWLPDGSTLLMSADEQAFSDLVQVLHAADGDAHDLFQGGKGMILFAQRPGLVVLLMATVFDLAVPRYNLVTLDY